MLMTMQILDACFLFGTAICALIMLAHDENYQAFWPRLGLIILGAGMFAQGMWLVGVWVPGSSGYPLPRLTIDGAMLFLGLHRVIHIVRAHEREMRAQKKNWYAH